MVALLVATALIQAKPPAFTLPIESSVLMDDRLVQSFGGTGARGLRGIVVADNGETVFSRDKQVVYMDKGADTMSSMPLFFRDWMPQQAAITSNQAGWLENETKTFDKTKQKFTPLEFFDILWAKDREHIAIAHAGSSNDRQFQHSCATEMSMEYGDPAANRLIYGPKGDDVPLGFIPDLSSDGLLVSMGKKKGDDADPVGWVFSGAPGKPLEIKPGYAPFLFDSKTDTVVCYTYSESGFPGGVVVKHLKSDATDEVATGGPGVGPSVLLPGGRLLVTWAHGLVEDAVKEKQGLYECDPPYKAAKYLGPYRLSGASRNGTWLLISHMELRKSWLVGVK